MTEASHQMSSNPLPPAARKPGSVGPGTGVKIGIMDDAGNLLATGERGEVVIQGPNVVSRIREQSRSQREIVHEWMVPHGRSGIPRCRRLSDADRAHQGTDQPRRRKDRAARNRRSAAGASGGGRSGGVRRAASYLGRGSRGRGRAAGAAAGVRDPRVLQGAPGGFQSARRSSTSSRRFRARRPERSSAALWPRRLTGSASEVSDRRRGRHRRLYRRAHGARRRGRDALRARPAPARDAGAGLRVLSAEGDFEVHPKVIGDLEDAGPLDVIFLGVKAHGLTQLAPQLKPLIAREHHGRQHAERHPVVVFSIGRGRIYRPASGARRSRRSDRQTSIPAKRGWRRSFIWRRKSWSRA